MLSHDIVPTVWKNVREHCLSFRKFAPWNGQFSWNSWNTVRRVKSFDIVQADLKNRCIRILVDGNNGLGILQSQVSAPLVPMDFLKRTCQPLNIVFNIKNFDELSRACMSTAKPVQVLGLGKDHQRADFWPKGSACGSRPVSIWEVPGQPSTPPNLESKSCPTWLRVLQKKGIMQSAAGCKIAVTVLYTFG